MHVHEINEIKNLLLNMLKKSEGGTNRLYKTFHFLWSKIQNVIYQV